jgi:hypothetical protein
MTGKKGWVRYTRLDNFDLGDLQIGFENSNTWRNVGILVLNPWLEWHYGLLPDSNDAASVRAWDLNRKHASEF